MHKPAETWGHTMHMDNRKTATLTLIGPFAIPMAGLNVGAESRGVARSALIGLVDCNIRDPLYPCVDTKRL
jgi:hypothetical protein